jgi:IS1 family transposase
LLLGHVQLDELKTRLRAKANEVWLWVAMDVQTKVIPAIQLGPRTQVMAYSLVHGLCLALCPCCVPVFTSDGLMMYYYALTAHFGQWQTVEGKKKPVWQVAGGLVYGQVKKLYQRRRLVRVEHSMLLGDLGQLKARLQGMGLSERLNTAFVERVNLTIRQAVAPLIRRTWGTAQTLMGLREHIEWWRGYYHFIRPHESLREELSQPKERGGRRIAQRYRQRTPAMAAGITGHRWTVREFLSFPLVAGIV